MKNRYHFLDNLRWVTVLLVLFYHVFYNFNSLGVFGAVGGFTDHQWQDIFCTLLNPWFMTLMFVVAGASSRYALQRRTPSEFRRERTRKLLVPSTLGLFVFGFVLGLLNMSAAGAQMPEDVPLFVKWLIAIPSGTGPLWFIQLLFGYSLLLLLVSKLVKAERIEKWLEGLSNVGLGSLMVAFGVLLWGASQSQIDNPTAAQGLLNLYRPAFYIVGFLFGYYVFSTERLHRYLAERAGWLVALAVVSAVAFGVRYYGVDYTAPAVVQSPLCNLYCWAMVLAMLGAFKRWADTTSPFADYMTRSSFGLYIVHMTACTAACLWLRGSGLPVWAIYALVLLITFGGSVVLWEVLRRVPVVRYCVFGIESKRKRA